jgi:hypothetical protein
MEMSNLNKVGVKEQYQFKITNRFAALGNLDEDVDIKRAWENNRGHITVKLQTVCVIMS